MILQSSNMYWGFSDFSPDGRFVVYQTEESGRPEIYVRPASGEDRRWQVSNGGGTAPVWSAAGDEIFFLSGPKLMAAPVSHRRRRARRRRARVLFANRRVLAFDAARDGRRFLIAEDPNPGAQPRLDVVVHWFAAVERKLAEARDSVIGTSLVPLSDHRQARRRRHGRGVPRDATPSSSRDVAIKVLPAEFAQDPERLARFEREAKLLASLNHPNIAHIYGFESATLADGSTATSWRWSWSRARTSPSG